MKIMKYILLTFALFYLNVSIWGQEKSIGITLEDVAGMKEKEKVLTQAILPPKTFVPVHSKTFPTSMNTVVSSRTK